MGARRDDELERAAARADLVGCADERISLPGGNERRRIVVVRKAGAS